MPDAVQSASRIENGQPGASTGIPLFYLGGDPTVQPLLARLRAVHPFHSLSIQTSIVRQLRNPYSLSCIAEHFVKAIRERQPNGPYMLGGWCAHGVLALETAQQLREQGQDVALLILLETINPARLRKQPNWVRRIARWQVKVNLARFEYRHLRSLGKTQALEYAFGWFARQLRGLHTLTRKSLERESSKFIELSGSTPLQVLYAASANYLPRPYDRPVLLLRGRKSVFGFGNDPTLGWGSFLGNQLEICISEGNHYTLYVEPHVQGLVEKMTVRLKNAEQRWSEGQGSVPQIA